MGLCDAGSKYGFLKLEISFGGVISESLTVNQQSNQPSQTYLGCFVLWASENFTYCLFNSQYLGK